MNNPFFSLAHVGFGIVGHCDMFQKIIVCYFLCFYNIYKASTIWLSTQEGAGGGAK